MAALTDEEKVRVRHHTGYPNAASVSTAALGVPASIETMFILEKGMDSLRSEAYYQVRRHLGILDQIEDQMVDDLELLSVAKVDEIDIRPDEQDKLVGRYIYWVRSLCNLFGIEPNPYDQRFSGGANGVNARVSH